MRVELSNAITQVNLLAFQLADDVASLLKLRSILFYLLLSGLASRHQLVDLVLQRILVFQSTLQLFCKLSFSVLQSAEDLLLVQSKCSLAFQGVLDALDLGLGPPALLFDLDSILLFQHHLLIEFLDLFFTLLDLI